MQEHPGRALIREMLTDQKVGVLATDARTQPYTTLVGFVADEDLANIYFVTTRSTRKFAALSGNPRVSLLIDNRANTLKDFRDTAAVTAQGEAREVDKDAHKAVVRCYLDKLPHLREFINSPTSALVQIKVSVYYLVTRFQQVMELHIQK
jgi:nitroimidazol reductase NimA-like FMN-containing flavoprotein (pyridoxamine 5'-phosphate oxidase superfamily)